MTNYDTLAENKWMDMAIDFDGVINMYSGWNGQHEDWGPRDGALEFIKRLHAAGWRITILTARDGEYLREAKEWMVHYGFVDYIHEVTNIKKPAKIYIDDRGLQFNGNFSDTLQAIEDYVCHWEEK
jgi:hypothetical protein